MKKLIKSMISKAIGWYIAPYAAESQRNQEQLQQLRKKYEDLLECTNQQKQIAVSQEQKFADIAVREEWTRQRFVEQDEKLLGLEKREEWTRQRFEEQEQKFAGIFEREEWTRQRFEEQEQKFTGIFEREEWTRGQFEKIEQSIGGMQLENEINSYAQSGEDMIISYILHFLQKPLSEVTYLDLGANHAKHLSNTYHFYQSGARGVLVEANPELIPELKSVRPNDIILNRAISLDSEQKQVKFYVLNGDGLSTIDLQEAENACKKNPELFIKATYNIETITMDEILSSHFADELTILSIDLEGIEEEVLEQIDFAKYKPWIIIIENIPYHPILSIDEREYKGSSLLDKKGYTEYAFTGINSIFLRRDVVEAFNKKRMQELQE